MQRSLELSDLTSEIQLLYLLADKRAVNEQVKYLEQPCKIQLNVQAAACVKRSLASPRRCTATFIILARKLHLNTILRLIIAFRICCKLLNTGTDISPLSYISPQGYNFKICLTIKDNTIIQNQNNNTAPEFAPNNI